MFIIRFFLLWSLVSLHIVGGAVLFRRFFPRESPWFGFVVPALALVLVMNFTEHQVAIPTLHWLLPLTTGLCLWLIVSPKTQWKALRLPTIIFLASFLFTFFLRFLKPNIAGVRDGIYDMQFVASFLMGQKLPVESTWIPPLQLINYYAFGHYGCSVLIRFFGFDLGTGFNVSAALISAWIYLLTAGLSWQISRGKLWITILAPILVVCAATGSTGYLWLMIKDLQPEDSATLYSRIDDPNALKLTLFHYLTPVYMYNRHELLVPGWWSWLGIFHSTSIGQFITLLTTFSIAEIVRPKRANWGWICCAGSVPLMLVASTWGFPYVALLACTGLAAAWYLGRIPKNPRAVIVGLGLIAACVTPMLLYYLTAGTPIHGPVFGDEHTQIAEFFIQWWPIYLPWLALLLTCRRNNPVVNVVLFMTPLGFAAVEYYSVGARFDMTGKIWGFIFCAAWATFLPSIATSRFWAYRILFGLIVINSALSLCFWTTYYWKSIKMDDLGQIDGKGDLAIERPKARILNALIPLKNQIIASGKSSWSFSESARLANFSGNRSYIAWSFNCDNDMFRNGVGEGERREKSLNEFYDGKKENPLLFLREHDIAAVVVWPDDNISDDVLAKLKRQLAPSYDYEDLRDADNQNPPNCGIFLYHPNILKEVPSLLTPPPPPAPAPAPATPPSPAPAAKP